jgi:hypothetical protein
LARLENTVPPPPDKNRIDVEKVIDSMPLAVRRVMVELFKAKHAELGRPAGLAELDWPPDLKKQVWDAFVNGGWRGDWTPPAPPAVPKPAPAKVAEPAAPGPEEPARSAATDTVPIAVKEPNPQAVPTVPTTREPIRIAFPKDPSARWVYGVPERLWRRLWL